MAAEQGVKVDEAKFRELMAEQKSRARADALKKRHNVDLSVYDDFKKTLVSPIDFLGYTDMSARAKVIGIMQEGKGSVPAVTGPANVEVILDRTPFYAEAGGQLADQGEILSDDGAVLEVDDVQKPIKDLIVHQCRLTEGTLVVGAEVNANIDLARRGAIARSHTATHMVHKALREELGPQATQRGSEDAPNRLRFDFQWSKAPAKSVISAVEERVNDKLRDNLAVTTKEMKFDDAIALGAMHLFGEKYGDIVRVVSIGEDGWSRELCGGTHVDHVGKIGMVNILSEASIGSGVRRVDAVVGQGAYDFNAREHALVSQLSDKLNARPDELAERVNALLAKLKESDRRLASMYESQLAASVPALVADTKNSAALVKVAVKNVGHFGAVDALRKTVLDVRAQLGEDAPVVVALAGVNEDDKPMVAVATNEAARKAGIKAGDLVRGAAKVLGGGGGGKPDFAQGGGVDASKIDVVWLGVDLGNARVGLALSDPELTFAHPAGNIHVAGDYFFAIDEVLNVIEDEHVDHVIVGLPLQMDGTEGKSAKKARRWAANLEKRLQAESEDSDSTEYQIPQVSLIDERLTTVSAHRQLFEAHKASNKHRPVVDQQSAVVILQTALDRTREQ